MSALRDFLVSLPTIAERRAAIHSLSADELTAVAYDWRIWARPDQLPPPRARDGLPDWSTWVMLGGRGSGKTRSAAEHIRGEVESGRHQYIGIIGPTTATIRRDVIEGPSGLLQVAAPSFQPIYESSKQQIVWPSGAHGYLLTTEEPEKIRGVNISYFWGDELTSWNMPEVCWSNLDFALRLVGPLGDEPGGVISTTPKRHKLLRQILADEATVVTRSSTYDNAANLAPSALARYKRRYEGTSLGRQELMAELLNESDGALWARDALEECRVHVLPDMKRIVVAIDPAGTANTKSDETGIIAAGIGVDGRGYVLADASGKYSPDGWARAAVDLYNSLNADRIVAEKNYGGDMVEATIRAVSPRVPVKMVTATRGKAVRAEPVSALYEQRRVSHVGLFPELEDQMCGWDPAENGPSPDRVDGLVWALTELMCQQQPPPARWTSAYNDFMAR